MLDYNQDQEKKKLLNQFKLEKVLLKYSIMEEICGLYNRDTLLQMQLRLIQIDDCIRFIELEIITNNELRRLQSIFCDLVQQMH